MKKLNPKNKMVKEHLGKNLKMSDEVYKLRKEVMSYVYEAKNLLRKHGINMPRVNVRITDNSGESKRALAMGAGYCIWISLKSVNTWNAHLRDVVFHELLHALKGTQHDEECPLMRSCVNIKPLTQKECQKHFLKYWL